MDEQKLLGILERFDITEPDEVTLVKGFVENRDLQGLLKSKILKKNTANTMWADIEKSRDILHLRYEVTEGPYKDITGVIMGACGNGKTSLVNNICGTVHGTGEEMESKTRNITCELVPYVTNGSFKIYDTPGTTAQVEVPKHASLLRASLTHRPINVIFVSLKYQRRGSDLISSMEDELSKVQKYSNKVVFLVSHVDIAEEPDKMMKEIYELMDKRELKQQVVFYSNTKCSKKRLALTLYTIGTNSPSVQIDIPEEEFLKKFRIGCIDSRFRKAFECSLTEIEQLTDEYIKCAVELQQNEEKQCMIQELALDLKQSLQERLKEFTEHARQLMMEHDYFSVYFALQKIILDSDEKFHFKTRHFLSYNMIHQSAEEERQSVLDLLKQCPSCKQIWLRVEACPNTTCGSRPSNFWDCSVGRAFFTYHIQKVQHKLKITRKKQRAEAITSCLKLSSQPKETTEIVGEWDLKKKEKQIRKKLDDLALEEYQLENSLSQNSQEGALFSNCASKLYIKYSLQNLGDIINSGKRLLMEYWDKYGAEEEAKQEGISMFQSAPSQYIESVNRMRWEIKHDVEELEDELNYRTEIKEIRSRLVAMISDLQRLEDQANRTKSQTYQDLVRQIDVQKMHIEELKMTLYKYLTKRANKTGMSIKLQNMTAEIYDLEKKLERCSLAQRKSVLDELSQAQKDLKELQAIRDAAIELTLNNQPNLVEVSEKLLALVQRILRTSAHVWKEFQQLAPEKLRNVDVLSTYVANSTLSSNHEKIVAKCLTIVREEISIRMDELQVVEADIVRCTRKGWIGCGYPMNFRTLPRIPNILEILKEMYSTFDINEVDAKLKADKEVVAQRKRIQELVQAELLKCESH